MTSTSKTGPYLVMAVLCEKVLTEADGVLSVIRIVDRVTRVERGAEVPEEMPEFSVSLQAVLLFKSGQARGRHTIKIRPETPSGQQLETLEMPVHFDGEERGPTLIVNLNFIATQEGLYWIDVLFEDELVTRMPLRVIYQPQRLTVGGTPA